MTRSISPVLAIHGSASSGRQWKGLASQLASHRPVIAPDVPGYGGLSGFAGRIDRLSYLRLHLDACDAPVDIVAHSFGSAIALRLANLRPGRVRSITLYDPVVPMGRVIGNRCLEPGLAALWSVIRNSEREEAMAHFIDYWVSKGTWAGLSDDRRRTLVDQYPAAMRDFIEITSGYWTPAQINFNGPIHCLWGQRSPSSIPAICAYLARTYTDVRCVEVPDAGHMAPLTQAARMDHLLAETIENQPAAIAISQPVPQAA